MGQLRDQPELVQAVAQAGLDHLLGPVGYLIGLIDAGPGELDRAQRVEVGIGRVGDEILEVDHGSIEKGDGVVLLVVAEVDVGFEAPGGGHVEEGEEGRLLEALEDGAPRQATPAGILEGAGDLSCAQKERLAAAGPAAEEQLSGRRIRQAAPGLILFRCRSEVDRQVGHS